MRPKVDAGGQEGCSHPRIDCFFKTSVDFPSKLLSLTEMLIMMIRRSPFRPCQARTGAHIVEFAVVVPVFLAFIFGLIEIGRGMMVSSLMSNAARAGCRAGIIPGSSNSSVTTAVD